jgi:siroheme decarboxylase
MIETTTSEALLLEEIQKDLPRCSRPFAVIGSRCGMSEEAVLASLVGFIENSVVRELSAILDARKLGYFSSLIAVSTPSDMEKDVAAEISRHPRVSHNYHRDHHYNLWFTLAAKSEQSLLAEATKMIADYPETSFDIMPALKTYKLRVSLRVASKVAEGYREGAAAPTDHATNEAVVLEAEGRSLLSRLEQPFPLVAHPWREIGKHIGMKEEEVLALTDTLTKQGVIRRVAGVLRHRKVGYTANGMCCFAVDADRMDTAGTMAAARPEVSHCYWRKTPDAWRYPLFAMVHATSEPQCRESAESIASEIACDDHLVLFSTIEYKKERAKYFGGDQ